MNNISRMCEYHFGSTTVNCDQPGIHGSPVAFSLFAFLQRGRRMLPHTLKCRINRVGLCGLDDEELRAALAAISPGTRLDIDPLTPPPLQGVLVGWRGLDRELVADSDSKKTSKRLPLDKLAYCTDLALTLSILARCEGNLYLGHRTPSGSLTELVMRPLAFDDPRLANLSCVAPEAPSHWPCGKYEVAAKARERAARRARTKSSKSTPRAKGRSQKRQGANS
jgi:hypothetical protein